MAVINVHGTALARGWGRREGGREGEARKRENQAEKAGERGLTQMENEEGKRMRRVEKKKEKRKKKIDGHRVSSATTGYTGYTNDKDESNFTITQRYPTPRCKSTPGFLIIDKNVRTHVPIGKGG